VTGRTHAAACRVVDDASREPGPCARGPRELLRSQVIRWRVRCDSMGVSLPSATDAELIRLVAGTAKSQPRGGALTGVEGNVGLSVHSAGDPVFQCNVCIPAGDVIDAEGTRLDHVADLV